MSVRLGINPLTWTIDDLPEVGGETTLETCLTEARAAGFDGVELGCKFPRTAPELKAALAPHGLALVSGWYSTSLLLRDAAAEFEAMRPHCELLSALGCDVVVVAETTRCIHGDRRTRLSQRPVLAPADWPRFAERLDELGSPPAGLGSHARLPSPHGHGRADRGRGGPPDGLLRRGGRAAARHRSPDLRRRRPGAGRGAPRRRALRTCIARTCGAPCSSAASIATAASSTPCSTAYSPCPATAASITRRRSRRSRARITAAGSSSRPNRTRASRLPPSTRTSGYRNLRRFADAQAWQ